MIASYAHMAPIITLDDLKEYFDGVELYIPDFATDNLSHMMDQVLGPGEGSISHDALSQATAILSCWLAFAQRTFGKWASGTWFPQPHYTPRWERQSNGRLIRAL